MADIIAVNMPELSGTRYINLDKLVAAQFVPARDDKRAGIYIVLTEGERLHFKGKDAEFVSGHLDERS